MDVSSRSAASLQWLVFASVRHHVSCSSRLSFTLTSSHFASSQELLGRSTHYSHSVRREALQGLRSLLDRHTEQVLHDPTLMMRLVEKIAPRISDENDGVRHEAHLLFRDLLEHAPVIRLAPFFPLILVHTRSALTTLAVDVRMDALRFVDLWLEHAPHLVLQQGGALLDSLLLMISADDQRASRAPTSTASADSTSVRKLHLNPHLSSIKARMAVVRRIHHFLEIVLAVTKGADGSASGARGLSRPPVTVILDDNSDGRTPRHTIVKALTRSCLPRLDIDLLAFVLRCHCPIMCTDRCWGRGDQSDASHFTCG